MFIFFILPPLTCHHSTFFCLCYILPSPPLYFSKPTPNPPHSYALDAETISICHASQSSLHQPQSKYPERCTNLHCSLYPSWSFHTSILCLHCPGFSSMCQNTLYTSSVDLSLDMIRCFFRC